MAYWRRGRHSFRVLKQYRNNEQDIQIRIQQTSNKKKKDRVTKSRLDEWGQSVVLRARSKSDPCRIAGSVLFCVMLSWAAITRWRIRVLNEWLILKLVIASFVCLQLHSKMSYLKKFLLLLSCKLWFHFRKVTQSYKSVQYSSVSWKRKERLFLTLLTLYFTDECVSGWGGISVVLPPVTPAVLCLVHCTTGQPTLSRYSDLRDLIIHKSD